MVDRLSTKLREVKKNAKATGDTTEANQVTVTHPCLPIPGARDRRMPQPVPPFPRLGALCSLSETAHRLH